MKNQSVIAKNHTKQEIRVIANEQGERGNSNLCHTEGEARSISNITKQERYFANAQYDKNIDCHADFVKSTRNDRMSPSLAKNTPPQPLPQGEGLIFDSPSLAEVDKGGGYQYAIHSNTTQFANANSTLPLTPSAREGEMERGNSAREGEQEKRNSAMEGGTRG